MEPKEEEDEVVQEVEIVVAPDFVNRLLFHTYEPHMQSAKFKKNVKQLRLKMDHKRDQYDDYMDDSDDENITEYQGDGFPHLDMINNAAGFFENGKLVLVPVRDIYDMRHRSAEAVPEDTKSNKIVQVKMEEPKKETVAPVRVKFGRTETDAKKKRREQSALHTQKLINEDPWIDLEVEPKVPSDMYKDLFTLDSMREVKMEVDET
ncbi:sin-like protein conserved region domain-containing protein [Ditylenchus destructor]|nr:sin-like protein conserved region domain-containing protein [Ditylenchus destructor]